MIVEFFLSVLMGFVTIVMNIIPNIPAIPAEIEEAGNWVISSVAGTSGLLAWVFGVGLYVAIIVTIIVILNFEHLYYAVLWVLRKLPFNSK